ncbi:tRNA cytosine-5-methylases and related enzymes of the NOL1/NOP2/sun superfamily [Phaffia rhodozyma]|uniref:tRNA cytosine-5-methylases and related enzymes of the NOL1/NOP2/sun superfamily n=1 Tax=Phaffia rhodozyma TaxID=264483 RepID=A0A0F7SHP0_PHARH|nr:tRNA cytosine-5-methylases and related enzymes of the NOL1/NOP2/sun superfamily [Phaffia rhodozyma]
MPRNNKRKGGKNKNKNSTGSVKPTGAEGDAQKAKWQQDKLNWKEIEMTNEKFATFYKAQKVVPEDEWDAFYHKLTEPLPVTFRFTGSKKNAQDLNELFKENFVSRIGDVEDEGVKTIPPFQIPWYPDGLGWQVNAGKSLIRKNPEYKKLQQFLVYETEVGNLSRQEAVSMIPPLFLDVLPHHLVLDMCAAPGSKTAQLLEALHASTADETNVPINKRGLVVANDSDLKRSHLLVHQSNRLPSANVLITNLDASRFPKISLGPDGMEKFGMKTLQFDRILCDVPCSGDGTMRKNIQIWNKWSPIDGNGLHALQLKILLRAMDLLKPGGRLVYSTCSFNPVENEAVISAALNNNSAFKIVDVSDRYPLLKRFPGLTTWKAGVGKDTMSIYDTYQEFLDDPETSDELKEKIHKTYWPVGNEKELGLERCMRLYPHHQDTGGFFVVVLEKSESAAPSPPSGADVQEKQAMNDEKDQVILEEPTTIAVVDSIAKTEPGSTGAPSEEPLEVTGQAVEAGIKRGASPSLESSSKTSQPVPKKARQEAMALKLSVNGVPEINLSRKPDPTFKEHPYYFLNADSDEVKAAVNFFELSSEFPTSTLYVRNINGDAVRSVYHTCEMGKAIIENNEYTRVRLVSAGCKLFARQDTPGETMQCKWRACQEGLQVLLPYVGKSKFVVGSIKDLRRLMETYYPLIENFEEPSKSIFAEKPVGSMIFVIKAGELDGGSLKHDLIMPLWKAKNSMSLMLAKNDKQALSNRIWGKEVVLERPPQRPRSGLQGSEPVSEPASESVSDEAAALNQEEAVVAVKAADE